MSTIPALLILGFIVSFMLILWFAVHRQQQAVEFKRQAAIALGFTPVKELDAGFIRRIEYLYQRPGEYKSFKLSNTACKTFPDGQMVLFDLWGSSGEDSSQEADQGLAIISPYLRLPKFNLWPKLTTVGRLAPYTNRFMQWLASQRGQRLDFSTYPDFDSRYIVTGDNTALDFLTPDLLNRLASLPAINLAAGGDIFAFSYSKYARPVKPGDPLVASQQISLAMTLFTWLTASRALDSLAPNLRPAPEPLTHCPNCGASLVEDPQAAGFLRCNYCDTNVEKPPNRPFPLPPAFVPSGALPSGQPAWTPPQAPSFQLPLFNSQFRLVSCFIVPFAILWTLFSLFFVFIAGFWYINAQHRYQLLSTEGQVAQGWVIGLETEEDSESGSSYYVTYQFTVPAEDGSNRVMEARQSVPYNLYAQLAKGQTVEILYVPSDPSISELSAAFGPPGIAMLICFGGVGLVFAVIGLGMVAFGIRLALSKKQLLDSPTNQQTA